MKRELSAAIVTVCFFLGAIASAQTPDTNPWYEQLQIGTWGEVHYNSGEGDAPDQLDLHRVALELGYGFNDWLHFYSETVLQNAFVSNGANSGDITINQLKLEVLLAPILNIRLGRFLVPIGIVNRHHRPIDFNGVERPLLEEVGMPSSWFTDGGALFGHLGEHLEYEVGLSSSLDGSQFSSAGISQGLQKQSSGFSEPAFYVRWDYVPVELKHQKVKIGGIYWMGGLDNGNAGVNPGLDADLRLYSGDVQYRVFNFDYRAMILVEHIDGAANIGANTSSEIFGWNAEAAWHIWPDFLRQGKLADSDALFFVRYENLDLQRDLPATATFDQFGERNVWVIGTSFFPVANLIFKADYEIRNNQAPAGAPNQFNLGMGWSF